MNAEQTTTPSSSFLYLLSRVLKSLAQGNSVAATRNFLEALTTIHGPNRRDRPSMCRMYRQALTVWPASADAWINHGVLSKQANEMAFALCCFDRSRIASPASHAAHFNFSLALDQSQSLEGRRPSARKAALLAPGHAAAWSVLANHLAREQPYESHARHHRRAGAIAPDDGNNWIRLGKFWCDFGRANLSRRCLWRAVVLTPDVSEAWLHLGLLSANLGETDKARQVTLRAVRIQPVQSGAWVMLSNTFAASQMHIDALSSLRHSQILDPANPTPATHRILISEFLSGLTFEHHGNLRSKFDRRWGRTLAAPSRCFWNDRDPERRLRIGYVSPDFREQSAAFCFGPAVKNHNKELFETHCYSGVISADEHTRAFREAADHWVDVHALSNAGLVEKILTDRIDILVDLSGFLGGNRMAVFAARPAPIQVTGWGLASGTGASWIDYLFNDPVGIPADARRFVGEQVVDLPCQIGLEAPPNAPSVVPPPVDVNGWITFGCMNRASKITDDMLDCCGHIMEEVPGSRLIFKDRSLSDPTIRRRFKQHFETNGVSTHRVIFLGATPRATHLATYNAIDVALDTFPFGGGVTTLEALWMGVPVVCMLGCSQPSRVAGSILSAIGRREWTAHDVGKYAELAIELAKDRKALRSMRKTLRDEVRRSEAGNPAKYALAVEAAYRRMWRSWCKK